MSCSLRVLLIEDSPDDAFLIERALRSDGFDPSIHRVETEAGLLGALQQAPWDLIICDYSLPQWGGHRALGLCRQKAMDVPIIIVSGVIGEEVAVEMMRAGAHDYVMKDKLGRLASAVRRELDAAQERREHRRAQEELNRMAAHAEAQRRQDERDRLQLIEDLRDALQRVKTLSGLLPICAGCKKIRDDAGSWHAIEVYIKQHSQAEFSHGLCPECARALYPDIPLTLDDPCEREGDERESPHL